MRRQTFEKYGAKRFAARQDVNKEDYKAVNEWIEAVVRALPSLGLKTIEQLGGDVDEEEEDASSAGPKRWGKSRPYPATVTELEGLCRVSCKEDKNTYRVQLDLGDSGMAYLPGDALGIYPTNSGKVGLGPSRTTAVRQQGEQRQIFLVGDLLFKKCPPFTPLNPRWSMSCWPLAVSRAM